MLQLLKFYGNAKYVFVIHQHFHHSPGPVWWTCQKRLCAMKLTESLGIKILQRTSQCHFKRHFDESDYGMRWIKVLCDERVNRETCGGLHGRLKVHEWGAFSPTGGDCVQNVTAQWSWSCRVRCLTGRLSHLRMQSRARMKKSLLSWCSSRRRAHCSNVTDMDVRSLALLQLVNLMPFNLRQICREKAKSKDNL